MRFPETARTGAWPAPRVTGRDRVPACCDEACLVDGVLVVRSSSEQRGSVLAFIPNGLVRLDADRSLHDAFSLRGGLLPCLLLSPAAAGLAVSGLLAPLLWPYGANHVLTAVRVPAHMERLCRTAASRTPEARSPELTRSNGL